MAGGQSIEDAINDRLQLLTQSEIPLMIAEMRLRFRQDHESVIGPLLNSAIFNRLAMERFAKSQAYLNLEDIKQIARQSRIENLSFVNRTFNLETLNRWLLLNSINDNCIINIDGFNNMDLKSFTAVFTIQHPDFSAHINGELLLAEGDISFNTKRVSLSWKTLSEQALMSVSGGSLSDRTDQPFTDFSDGELAPFKNDVDYSKARLLCLRSY
ncbi:hypothetical protein HNW13_017895 [Shewanella sp. BF02_Schw]|uniref:hypothetical protein n=1 Tax=Shewanella sp. BF02_Schw TaxID=394908 RepID=UPI001AA1776F|nr:hypothetical protein [Shewanella sp. BF02_Schw]MBO1897612.1 hypothetical protein [Shewanella sp. BF02_Schw]